MALADDDVHITVDHVTSLATFGEPIDVRVLILDIRDRVDLQGEVSVADWERAYSMGAFHLDDEPEAVGWKSDRPVTITLRLRHPLAKRFDESEELFTEFFKDSSSPLRHSEAWVMLEAMQEVPLPDTLDATSSIGVHTSWADDTTLP